MDLPARSKKRLREKAYRHTDWFLNKRINKSRPVHNIFCELNIFSTYFLPLGLQFHHLPHPFFEFILVSYFVLVPHFSNTEMMFLKETIIFFSNWHL
jgi:hypothetical protein